MDFLRIIRRNEQKQTLPDQIRQFIAGMQYFDIKINQMELQDKDVVLVLGPSKSGKGIVSLAMMGETIKKFNPFDFILENPEFKDSEMGTQILKNNQEIFMKVDKQGKPMENQFVSHQKQQHTMIPKLMKDDKEND